MFCCKVACGALPSYFGYWRACSRARKSYKVLHGIVYHSKTFEPQQKGSRQSVHQEMIHSSQHIERRENQKVEVVPKRGGWGLIWARGHDG